MKNAIRAQTEDTATPDSQSSQRLLLGILLIVFALIVVRRAWISDDAFITLRTIDNFVNGHGLRWNIAERVQTYTHPLWLFVLTPFYFVTRDPVFTIMLVGLVVSCIAVYLLVTRIAASTISAALAVSILILSMPFVDYSTSGLENPLSHLLVVVFYAIYFGQAPTTRKMFHLSLVSALAALNRMDTFLLLAPALLLFLWELRSWRAVVALLAGQLPLLLWLAFATLYYGFPFPNTAYAKLNTGIPRVELLEQGLYYLLDSVEFVPIAMMAIVAGVALALFSKDRMNIAAALGIGLYLVYVVIIGGDFMSGRFLTAPLLVSTIFVARYDLSVIQPQLVFLLFALVAVVGLGASRPTLSVADTPTAKRRITEERSIFASGTALLSAMRGVQLPNHAWADQGRAARAENREMLIAAAVGMTGYFGGPGLHIIDRLAITDPLLARLPTFRDRNWRVSHYERVVPDGYRASVLSGTNEIKDSRLAQFYDKLVLITQGPLLDRERLRTIWMMNTGRYQPLIDFEAYRYPEMVSLAQKDLTDPEKPGVVFSDSGVEIVLDGPSHAREMVITLTGPSIDYEAEFLNDGREVAAESIVARFAGPEEPFSHRITIPEEASAAGFDKIRVFPLHGDLRGDIEANLNYLELLDTAGE